MLAIIYVRVSTEEQAKSGYSLPSQLEACRQRAFALGVAKEDVIEIVEDGVTGAILERPGLSRARELIRQGGIKYFICLDPDRFSRDFTNQLIVAREILRAGVKLEFTAFKFEDTPHGQFFFNILGAVAELEKNQIRERMMRGQKQKAKQGKIPANLRMYGYILVKGHLVVNPTEQAIYLKCLELAANGTGCHGITRTLNEMGVPTATGKQWRKGTVLKMLRNPAPVTGELVVNKWDCAGVYLNKYREEKLRRQKRPPEEWITIRIPKLLEDKSLWDRVQEELDRGRKMHCGYALENYLLSGLLRCGLCGSSLHGARVRRGKKLYLYYACNGIKNDDASPSKCKLAYMNAQKMEKDVWSLVSEWIHNPELFFKALTQDAPTSREDELKETETLLNSAIKERARLIDLAQKGLVPLQEIETRLKDVKTRIDKLTTQQNILKRSVRQKPRLRDVKAMAEKWEGRLYATSFAERKELVREVVEQITVHPDRIEIRLRFPH